jgi:MerR family transcriptional regulator, light-induced transcriptional regulator
MISTTPAFNLKVVLKETSLAADTLRAWERRYGLPVPQRTQGGHRLYSQRDIETIKWLMARQAEGLSISRAVDLWNEQTASGSDPLAGTTPSTFTSLPVPSVLSQPVETTLDSLRSHWVMACMNFNESTAEQILNQAFSMFTIESVCVEVLQKGIAEIGNRWYTNNATVQQEHFASGLAMRRLDALLLASPISSRQATVLIGCPPDEWHTFTPLLLALFLRRRGINVIYLGANVPAQRFADTIKDVKADLVVLVAQQLITAATLQATAQGLSSQKIPVAFGGRIFNVHPTLVSSIAGHFLGNELTSAVDGIDLLLKNNGKQPKPLPASPVYVAAHHAYETKRPQIELTVQQSLEPLVMAPDDLKTGIHFLGENITAALQLGNMSYVSAEVDWLKALLQAHAPHPEQLVHFMDTYSKAVDKNINGQGKPIFEWFSAEMQKLKA